MTLFGSRVSDWPALLLIGGGVVLPTGPALRAGQPITFSSPKKEVDAPPRKDVVSPPKPTLKWDLPSPTPPMPTLPPLIIIDPRAERLRRERLQEDRHWLLREPDLFQEKRPEIADPGRTPVEEAFRKWDENVERVLGKPDLGKSVKNDPTRLPVAASFSDSTLLESGKRQQDQTTTENNERSLLTLKESPRTDREASEEPADKDALRNDSEAAMKALFDTSSSERLPLLPGMSLYEMLGAAQTDAKEIKREREARREEFHRLLAPQDTPAATPAEAFGAVADQTRNLMNPVAPLSLNRALPARTPAEPIVPPSPTDKLSRPKLPFDEVAARYQGPALSPSASPENKVRQMESLKLMNRPSVLTMPGRQF